MLLDALSACSSLWMLQVKYLSCPSFRAALNAGIGPAQALDEQRSDTI